MVSALEEGRPNRMQRRKDSQGRRNRFRNIDVKPDYPAFRTKQQQQQKTLGMEKVRKSQEKHGELGHSGVLRNIPCITPTYGQALGEREKKIFQTGWRTSKSPLSFSEEPL